MSFPRYPKYKDSGVEWLGEVPEHWERSAFKRMATFENGYPYKPSDRGEQGLPIIRIAQLTGGAPPAFFEGDVSGHVVVAPGDLLFSWSATIDAYIWGNSRAVLNQHIFKVSLSPEVGKRFLFYLIKHVAPKFADFDAHGSTMRHIKKESLGETVFAPPLYEQTAIAAFLDRETAKIDALIAEQQRLIELLDEQLKALALSSFNTPGTAFERLGTVVQVVSRPVVEEPGTAYTRLGLYNRGRGIFHKEPSEPEEMGDSDFFWVEEGDLILSGQFAWEGAVAVAGAEESHCVVSHRYPIVRGREGILRTEFLFCLLSTDHGNFLLNENSRGAAGRNRPLNIGSLLKEKVPVPETQLQDKAAQVYHQRQALLKQVAIQLEILQERRSALISAAVTGQIDVRGLEGSEAA